MSLWLLYDFPVSMAPKKLSIKRLILIFSAITVCVVGIMAALTSGPKTWQAIRQIHVKYMILALILGALSISIDSLVLLIICRAAGTKIKFFYSVETILFYMFLSSVTPTVTGGEALMVYQLTQKGMPLGKATSVILLRGMLIISIIAIAAPVIVYFHGDLIQNIILKNLFRYIAVFLFLIVMFLVYTMLNPLKGEEVIHKVCLWVERWKPFAKYAERLEKKLNIWIDDFSSCLKEFFKSKKKILLAGSMLSTVALSANYLIAYVIMKGLNHPVPVLRVLMVQFVLYFLLYFTPTPGGTGVAEGGCYAMFAASIPNHLLGIFVILWRVFTVYLWVILGGMLITKTIGLDLLDKIFTSGDKNSDSCPDDNENSAPPCLGENSRV
ncbi:MAG: flippase-like domain-containing protein [bacterium]